MSDSTKKKISIGFVSMFLLCLLLSPALAFLPEQGRDIVFPVAFIMSAAGFVLHPKLMLMPNRRACLGVFTGLFLVFTMMNAPEIATRAQNKPVDAAEANSKAKEARQEKTRQSLWIVKTQDTVRSRLKDPSSAQFRNVVFKRHEGTPIVCGEVNSKNGFGAYGGFQHFVGSGERLIFLEEEVKDFASVWNTMCAK